MLSTNSALPFLPRSGFCYRFVACAVWLVLGRLSSQTFFRKAIIHFLLRLLQPKKVVAEETKVQKLFFFCASTTDFSITSTFSFKS
ncbi:hypothetical protein ES332_D10G123100v1 [Gossypium tomentosum]|uniref:Uncharacterized protein n=1 Tax=Gossypium tomentosum TaxID=34277 RepID=A0A5D2J3E3_GOSTO|nr:hypothetical protein ES332_D10G123100v1 [Gossypium tomentosum]